MDMPWLPPLPPGYGWAAMQLADGRTVIEVRFQDRHLVAYAFQPKRRRGWYLGGERLGGASFVEDRRSQCATMSEACSQLANWARQHMSQNWRGA
ncbi:hypothetical protein ASD86_09375 [Lysobacter sp. Root690]|nr:hypothetical protein ASD86_09375 [Lysobacter sp. Root690]